MGNTDSSFTLLELFNMGGVFMWPLLLFSIVTTAIALERAFYISCHNLKLDDLYDTVSKYIKKNDIPGVWQYLKGVPQRRLGARILLVIVERARLSERHIEKAAKAEALNLINSLKSGFSFLTALGSLSPLTGFLGTVSGMIGAFRSIAEAADVNAQIVANGIYEALITMVFGLIIAIIATAAHSLLTHIVDNFASGLEKTCSDLIMEIVQMENSSSWRRRQATALFSGVDIAVSQDVMAPDSYQLYTADFPPENRQKPNGEDPSADGQTAGQVR